MVYYEADVELDRVKLLNLLFRVCALRQILSTTKDESLRNMFQHAICYSMNTVKCRLDELVVNTRRILMQRLPVY